MNFNISIYPESIANMKKADINTKKVCAVIANFHKGLSLQQLAEVIENQHIWCPAEFNGSKKCQDELKSIQLFALDFDGCITIDEVFARAEKYKIPIALCYETMSSKNYSRFRIVFACNQTVTEKNLAVLIQYCIYTIFPEADSSSKDFSKLYYPGRNVQYTENTWFCIYDLLLSTMQYLSDTNFKNKTRDISKIASKTHIVLKNNVFFIQDYPDNEYSNALLPPPPLVESEEMLKIEEFRACTIYNNRVDDIKSSKSVIYFSTSKNINMKTTESEMLIRTDIKQSYSICRLLNEFQSGKRLNHDEWFGLMTNLIHLKGGQKLFTDTIEKYSDSYGDISRKHQQMKWTTKNEYRAYNCDNYCPYADKCVHGSNICYTLTERNVYPIEENIEYISLDSMRDKIRDTLNLSINQYGIKVIEAPTGSGKTHAYLNMVKNSNTQCIVAVPTSKLMNEICNSAYAEGISCYKTPLVEDVISRLDNETKKQIIHAYTTGNDPAINFILRNCECEAAAMYLDEIDNIRKCDVKMIVTTHSRLLNWKEDYLSSRKVIIDEDILPSMLQIEQVSIKEINKLLCRLKNTMPIDVGVLKKLKNILSFNGYSIHEVVEINSSDIALINNCIDQNSWTSNIFHTLGARYFYHEKGNDNVLFLYVKNLRNCSYTILSATADETMYKSIFKERLTGFYDLGHVRNKGSLIQYYDKSYSKDCLQNNPKLVEQLREKHSNCDIITFKDFAKLGEIYLGASQGLNSLKGHNIALIGTFHRPEFVYKLIALFLTDNTSITNDVLAVRRIQRNGYSFKIMTFSNELLRTIQLWMIESETMQAIGRARLLNYNCKVYLYSNFMVRA